ncbi:MAG: hypothetical protein ACQGVC_10495 [Myxococcota bacterium]
MPWKRNAVVAFLVAFAIWPAVHRVLVATWDVNPWKLAGWAMYARPHFPGRLVLRLNEGGQERLLRELSPREQALAADFVERRYSAGRLASPDALAEALLARHPRADFVVVELRTPVFDLASATLKRRIERIRVAR